MGVERWAKGIQRTGCNETNKTSQLTSQHGMAMCYVHRLSCRREPCPHAQTPPSEADAGIPFAMTCCSLARLYEDAPIAPRALARPRGHDAGIHGVNYRTQLPLLCTSMPSALLFAVPLTLMLAFAHPRAQHCVDTQRVLLIREHHAMSNRPHHLPSPCDVDVGVDITR